MLQSNKSANRANIKSDLINTCFVVYHSIREPHGVIQIYFGCTPGVISKYLLRNLVALYAIKYVGMFIRRIQQVGTKYI